MTANVSYVMYNIHAKLIVIVINDSLASHITASDLTFSTRYET